MNLIFIASPNQNYLELIEETLLSLFTETKEKFIIFDGVRSEASSKIARDLANTYSNSIHETVFSSTGELYDTVPLIDRVFVVGMPMFSDVGQKLAKLIHSNWHNSKYDRVIDGVDIPHVFIDPAFRLYAVLGLYSQPDLFHFVIDPKEIKFIYEGNTRQFYYDKMEDSDYEYLPLQFYMYSQGQVNPRLKLADFTLGISSFKDKTRDTIIETVKEIQSAGDITVNLRYSMYDAITGVKTKSTIVSRNEYLLEVLESKITLVVPSYHIDTFSMLRFVESVMHDCLPLVHQHAMWTLIPDIEVMAIVANNLLVDNNNLEQKLHEMLDQDKWREVLDRLQATKMFQDIIDQRWYTPMIAQLALTKRSANNFGTNGLIKL